MEMSIIVGTTLVFYLFVTVCLYLMAKAKDMPGYEDDGLK